MKQYEVIIIGGGPAGMAAAFGAHEAGATHILLLERQNAAGGVLNQCIHDGFGTVIYDRSYTGPEYAEIWNRKICDFTEIKTSTTVIRVEKMEPFFQVICIGGSCGYEIYMGKTVIFAMGCRERTTGQLRIPGSRPAGIYTAGCAQYMMNVKNMKPGRNAVIFGTGDIGLIMARRLMLEGIQVKLIFGDRAAGLARNYVQCVRDFHISLKLGYTLLSVHGYNRLQGVTIAPLREDGRPDIEHKQYVRCDMMLTAVGLIPETEIFRNLMPELSRGKGIPVDSWGQTDIPGIFACGNVTRIFDLADYVTLSGIRAGRKAAEFIGCKEGKHEKNSLVVKKERTFEGMESLSETELICVCCPKGCMLQTTVRGDTYEVSGNQCRRGYDYALSEKKCPRRILTTTVKIKSRDNILLPVRTDQAMKRDNMREAVKILNKQEIELPVQKGDIIVEDLLGTGINVIASKSMGINYEL